ncbi:MAG: hypothetical protein ABFD60_07990 [Bryobacteraceae bacterium]
MPQPTLESIIASNGGFDNYGNPKSSYVRRVFSMSDAELEKECEDKIWLAAYAANNPRSDFHWHVDVCFAVVLSRDADGKMYERAYKRVEEYVRGQ